MSDQLRSIFARWQNLEEEKRATSEALKDLFAEAKGNGFDPKALRAAFRIEARTPEEDEKAGETERLTDVYLQALRVPNARPAPARVENITKSPANSPIRGSGSYERPNVEIKAGPRPGDDFADLEIPANLRRAS